jgi:hypothetical protein
MKTKFLFMMIAAAAMVFAGCSKDDDENEETTFYAATTQTWTFGNQTWSDAIQMPDCNKEAFEDSDTAPQGRSYTSGGKTYYYYNWVYVSANKDKMCPSPWRVPSSSDMEALLDGEVIDKVNAWGFGGYAYSGSVHLVETQAYYWNNATGYYWYGYGNEIDVSLSHGFQVRCVK